MQLNSKKIILFFGILLSLNVNGISQNIFLGYNVWQTNEEKHNLFVSNSSITWACEMRLSYFIEKGSKSTFDIYNYLVNAQQTNKIKSYSNFEMDDTLVANGKNDYYRELSKAYFTHELNFKNPARSINFHEIFYIENHKLKSQIIAAGPEFEVIIENGLKLGTACFSYSSLNYSPNKTNAENDEILSLGNIYTNLNFDSLFKNYALKIMYGKTLFNNIWNDLANGHNKVYDLKYKKQIPAKDILELTLVDGLISVPHYDSLGYPADSIKIKGALVEHYFYTIGISQKLYYNKSKDFFYSIIDFLDIYILAPSQKNYDFVVEKRFRVSY